MFHKFNRKFSIFHKKVSAKFYNSSPGRHPTSHPVEREPLAELGGDDQEDGLRVRKLLLLLLRALPVDVGRVSIDAAGVGRISQNCVIG